MSSTNRKGPEGGNKSIIPIPCCCHIEVQSLLYGKDIIISPFLGTAVAPVEENWENLDVMTSRKRVLREGSSLNIEWEIFIQFVCNFIELNRSCIRKPGHRMSRCRYNKLFSVLKSGLLKWARQKKQQQKTPQHVFLQSTIKSTKNP